MINSTLALMQKRIEISRKKDELEFERALALRLAAKGRYLRPAADSSSLGDKKDVVSDE